MWIYKAHVQCEQAGWIWGAENAEIINAKRSSLAPLRANKIIFVYENDRFVAALKDD